MQIKGYTTLAEISEVTGIPRRSSSPVFGVTAEEMGLPLKDLKDAVRLHTRATCARSCRLASQE